MHMEARVVEALAAILAPLSPGEAIPSSQRFEELQLSLERYLPPLLGMPGRGLDGFRFCVAQKTGPNSAELLGVALLLAEQEWTPFWLRVRLSEPPTTLSALDGRLGEARDEGDGLLALPYGSHKLTKLLFQLPARAAELTWAYEARVGAPLDEAAP